MINFVVALAAEAKPLIAEYHLVRDHSVHAFPFYMGDDISLIVSGSGKLASAAAVGFVAAMFAKRECAWLNIGIAGHQTRALATAVLVNKITDRASKKAYYPFMDHRLKLESAELCTVEQAESNYVAGTLYDMEASGFFEAANRFASIELIRSLKIVSDNELNPIANLKPATVSTFVQNNLATIEQLFKHLLMLLAQKNSIDALPEVWQQWQQQIHFTVAESHQFKALLHNLKAIVVENKLKVILSDLSASIRAEKIKGAQELIQILRKKLESNMFVKKES